MMAKMRSYASLAALDDLYRAVETYLVDPSPTNHTLMAAAFQQAKASKDAASTVVDL